MEPSRQTRSSYGPPLPVGASVLSSSSLRRTLPVLLCVYLVKATGKSSLSTPAEKNNCERTPRAPHGTDRTPKRDDCDRATVPCVLGVHDGMMV